jgi:SAM-dependent methyltransferase
VIPAHVVCSGHTCNMVANISYGTGVLTDDELRLCGDVSEGKRAVELGVSEWFNSVAFARAGAKAIAVDPDPIKIADMRSRADAAEVSVQCHTSDLADLELITSSTCAGVVAAHTIGKVDDLGRLLRQVHRVLQPSMPFVISLTHPFCVASEATPYGTTSRSISDWFTSLSRANFLVDQIRELGSNGIVPTNLVLRARKEGS